MIAETIHDTISSVFRENSTTLEVAKPVIRKGSDDYLDLANEYAAEFKGVTESLGKLNERLIAELNKNSQVAYAVLPELRGLHSSCVRVHTKFMRTDLAVAMKGTLEEYKHEFSYLKEMIDDIVNIHVTIKSDENLQSLFSQL